MSERIIRLNFNKRDYEEIYFRDNQGSLFFSPASRSMTITAIVIAVVLGFLYVFNLISIDNVGIYYFLSFIFLICFLRVIAAVLDKLKWKKGITDYFKLMEVYTIFELQLTDDFLHIKLDHDESFTRWDEFKNIQVNDQFIALEGKMNYLFPQKSMNTEDYIYFKDSIKKILAQKKSEPAL